MERDCVEALWVELKRKSGTILLGIVYCPPNTTTDATRYICDVIEAAAQEGKEMVIMGDFMLNMMSQNAGSLQLQSSAFERAECVDVLDSDHLMIYGVYTKGKDQ